MKANSKSYFDYVKKAYLAVDQESYYSKYLKDYKNFDQKKILDIGCGLGILFQQIEKMSNNVELFGVDVNTYTLGYAKNISRKAHFMKSSADSLPFSDREFDVVFALDLIEHLSNYNNFLSEVRRITKDDGLLILSTPDRLSRYIIPKNILPNIIFNFKRLMGAEKVDPTHYAEFTIWKLSKALITGGFIIEKCNGYTRRFVPFHRFGSIIVRCRKDRRWI